MKYCFEGNKNKKTWRERREDKNAFDKNKTELMRRLGNIWFLLVLSFRDIFVLSLRNPHAYAKLPQQVSSESLRETNGIIYRGAVYLAEGVAAAILIDLYYPCREFTMFRYVGWICVAALILSVEILVISSNFLKFKILVATKRCILERNLIIVAIGTSICLITIFIFHISGERSGNEVYAVVILLCIHIVISAIILALFYMFAGPSEGDSCSSCCIFSSAYRKIKGFLKCSCCRFDRRQPSTVRYVFINDRYDSESRCLSKEYEEIPRVIANEIIQIESSV